MLPKVDFSIDGFDRYRSVWSDPFLMELKVIPKPFVGIMLFYS